MLDKENVTLPLFFMMYAVEMNWSVPNIHIEVCEWLEDYGNLGVLELPRGHGKSTILEIYNAYKIYKNPNHLMLHQGATDSDAYKISRGTAAVLEKHPLTKDFCIRERGEVQKWWVGACEDVKHGNLHARGILSNVTGSRANEIQNDDVETPNTTGSQDLRDKLAYRLSEQIHILIPGGTRLFVGTPHTHDSIYDKLRDSGANCFIRPMYSYSKRMTDVKKGKVYKLDNYDNYYVFSGIGSQACIPKYVIINNHIVFKDNYNLVDIYSEALWPERFTSEIMLQRRIECSNINEWDSQYMLASKPIDGNALDIDKFIPYSDDIKTHKANFSTECRIGNNLISSVIACWDPSSGKQGRDVSALSVVFKDVQGRLYWHECIALKGDIAESDDKTGRIIGGQVMDVIDVIEKYNLPAIYIEVNGIGGHVPAILRAALKTRGLSCSVLEIHNTGKKNDRIMNIQSYLLSNSLYIHTRILNNPNVIKQINNFNPNTTKNKDDYLDSLASCIINTPSTLGFIDIHKTTQFNNNYNMYQKPVIASGW